MRTSNFELVREFHEAFDVPVLNKPAVPDGQRQRLRVILMKEELNEVVSATYSNDLPSVAKELTDLLYAVYGTAHEYGIQLNEVFRTVHESNMSKLGNDGKPVIRPEDGKVLKGPNYKPPDMETLLPALNYPDEDRYSNE